MLCFSLIYCQENEIMITTKYMELFNVNDKVMHCREGLSVISSTTIMGEREYFIVRSLKGDGEAIYVPKLTAESIIRKLMSVGEADKLLESLKGYKLEFNPNTKQRRDAFKRRLGTGDINDIAYLFYQGYLYDLYPDGIKLGPSDIDMLGFAKNFLFDELALVYQVDRDKIDEFVKEKIK